MTVAPIRLDSNNLGCPSCKIDLETKDSSFYVHSEYVGHFESLVCSICNYHLFTSKGYDAAIKQASKFGFVGQEEELEFDDTVDEKFTISSPFNSKTFFEEILLNNDSLSSRLHPQSEKLVITQQSNSRQSQKRLINY